MNNMSQQELAELVGYKGKSMIAHVENGRVDLSASMISKFAKVFNVSELELMGLNDISNALEWPDVSNIINGDNLLKEFIDLYQSASPDVRESVLNLLRATKHNS